MRQLLRTLTTEDVSNLDPALRGAAILWVSKKYANRTDGEHCKGGHSPVCNVTWYEVRERKQHRALGPGKGSLEEVTHALSLSFISPSWLQMLHASLGRMENLKCVGFQVHVLYI